MRSTRTPTGGASPAPWSPIAFVVRGRKLRLASKLRGHPILIAICGGLLAYILYGASRGDLYLPSFGVHPATHLIGLAAWLCVPIPFLFYFGVVAEDSIDLSTSGGKFIGRGVRLVLWYSGGFLLLYAYHSNG
jgi:hypothetical protein